MPGSHNDVNVLDRSHLFTDLTDGRAPSVSYRINGTHYSTGYYPADGIYPPWAKLVQTISNPQAKKKKFLLKQKNWREKMSSERSECCNPTCVILRHMAFDQEKDPDVLIFARSVQENITSSSTVVTTPNLSTDGAYTSFISRYKAIRSSELQYRLRNDLIKYLWARSGTQNAQ
uniref:Uncharacterized protein AlNc14C170G7971 n=1 Tax=Albugo laibachii Nc14 TaxID=890382 RepID=F0WNE4_9STRA|nr:Conserved hypothetical protein [Albugo laibachii Nc14]|eukprot:CCA22835.1 Conserved hypothetical protein [Albugo laibachii Nc14]